MTDPSLKQFSLKQLYDMKKTYLNNDYEDNDFFIEILENIKEKEKVEEIDETTSATGGLAVSGGSGAVVSGQPSGIPGENLGKNWMSNGSVDGEGNLEVPYNPSGNNRVFQKIKTGKMGKDHGPRTGKKSRKKRIDMKKLRDDFEKQYNKGEKDGGEEQEQPTTKKKVMNFDNFLKDEFDKPKK